MDSYNSTAGQDRMYAGESMPAQETLMDRLSQIADRAEYLASQLETRVARIHGVPNTAPVQGNDKIGDTRYLAMSAMALQDALGRIDACVEQLKIVA